MKYKKMTGLLTVGALIAPTVLSTQEVLANEIAEDGSKPTSSVQTDSTDPTSSTGATSSTDSSSSETSSEPKPEIKKFSFLAAGKALENNTYTDAHGNVVKIQDVADAAQVEEGTKVRYQIEVKPEYELVAIKFLDKNNNSIHADKEVTGTFDMPASDVTIQLEVKEKAAPEQPQNNNSDHTGAGEQPQANTGGNQAAPAVDNRQPSTDGAEDVRIPSNQQAPVYDNAVQTAIVQEAYRQLGKPYVWGAKGPNAFDCSGLTYFVYANATGHYIGSWTGDQQYAGTQIPVSEAQPGDLLFWGSPTSVTSHVAIYIGNGQYIHAPQPGESVKIGTLSGFMPTFAVRVNIAGLPMATTSLENAFGEYSTNEPFVFNKNQPTDRFIEKIGEASREIGQKNGIYASVMIAQAILESGSGNSMLAAEPNYNLFGIKGKYKNEGVSFRTMEQDAQGKSYQITAEFRKYPSYKESLEDYAKLMKEGLSSDKNYYKPIWKSEAKTYTDATKYLQGRYATDKQYAEKLNAIIEAYKLTEFDKEKPTSGPKEDDFKVGLTLDEILKVKLSANRALGISVPDILSRKYFVDLFRGDSLILLAASTTQTKRAIDDANSSGRPVYLALNKGAITLFPSAK